MKTLERLDVYLTDKLDKTRSAIKKLSDDGYITVNGVKEKAGKTLKIGDEITVVLPDPAKLDLEPENMPLDVVYQDEDVAVINKAQGVTGIVHRIDKDTSGLLVVAKNDAAHLSLSEQIKDKTCARIYNALVEGTVKTDNGEIETYIGRSDKNRTMMAVTDKGRIAITDYEVVKRYPSYTLMRFSLKTGRTHQIRVHCKYIGHPIVGDPVYGYKTQKFKLNGQLLHAAELSFNHPRTGERMTFRAPLPDYFEDVLKKLDKQL